MSEISGPNLTELFRARGHIHVQSNSILLGGLSTHNVLPVSWTTSHFPQRANVAAAAATSLKRRRERANAPAASYWLRPVLDDGRRAKTRRVLRASAYL